MISEYKIGVLYPQSVQYKTLAQDFIRGIKMAGLPAKFCVESIGLGTDDKLVLDKIQKFQHQEEISIIIGFFGHHNISQIYEYAEGNKIILLAADLGATLPYSQRKYNGVYINSYGLHESSYLLGNYFSDNGYKNICSSTSYYDAGYGFLASLHASFEEKDINFAGHYITPHSPRENEAKYMEHAINNGTIDAVFAYHSGLFAEEHAEFIMETDLLEKHNYYVLPFTFKEKLAEKINPDKFFIAGSWIGNDTTFSCAFTKQYNEEYSENPSVFSILGYENALILKAAMDKADGIKPYNAMIESVGESFMEGPRGAIKFNSETNRTYFDHYIYKILKGDNKVAFEKKAVLKNDGRFIQSIMDKEFPPKAGGWQNAYLCH